MQHTQIDIPSLVRIKAGAAGRVGIYARRNDFTDVVILHSSDLKTNLMQRLREGLEAEQISVRNQRAVEEASFEQARELFTKLPSGTRAILGYGGGKALDTAKYVSFLSRLPYISIPTSLSNDGMCSPQSSLSLEGRRKSLPSSMPFGVVIDTEVCLEAPEILWLSGVGDLVAKLTAITDWKLAFHAVGTKIDDFAALLSDSTVFQFIARPQRDLEGVRLLGTALMLNGISMGVCGSSRPASGSEHLISHALDSLKSKPALHGLQVGVATYLVSLLQKRNSETIAGLFEKTGFWDAIASDPFKLSDWIEAVRLAPEMKEDFYTVLSSRDCLPEAEHLMRNDPWLKSCFVE
ncbi:iron-containing alcohol dehydrogenase family protein [Natronogracilivirga saccharolytica]|uniref:Iron-containing alcohol dehydrogenase family protein n=1 Tax=Natronogracilivirga saccharolytica TaxID=2812953 RepID=A0A8J7RJR0_9BACT|nr:iron-containing alcohol dehydrogenase family protein [Natronogracilivirga saccharolytica]MBP3193000.1 iron-containing alcohol dehydrogenase family protein [Natronogracilivirga saccharolytica]